MNKSLKTLILTVSVMFGVGIGNANADTVIQKNHVLDVNPSQQAGLSRAPWTQVHLHSTANPNGTMQGERLYMGNNWQSANYTHIVGWNYETGRAESWEVMPKGGAYDMGGVDNWEGWASIEFSENIPDADAFKQAYQVYLDTARQLVREIGGDYNLDDGTNTGLVTHWHSSQVGRGSDHTDPLGFLSKWGVSYEQFKLDLKTGKAFSGIAENNSKTQQPTPKPNNPTTKDTADIAEFKKHGNQYYVSKAFRVDAMKYVNGQYQMVNYKLAGGKNYSWTNNGIPLSMVDNVTRGNVQPTKVGDMVKISVPYNYGTIDQYDNPTNGVGIVMGSNGMIWFNAEEFLKL